MSRAPSEATKIRNLTRMLRNREVELQAVKQQREAYRLRATKAEQEAAEWKRRFDILLSREPTP